MKADGVTWMPESSHLRVFVSSIQKELENERIAVTELVASDPFLDRHVRPVLFEQMPGSPLPARDAYLSALSSCEVYLGILGFEYGRKGEDGLSATHREYEEAKRRGLPTYFFVKGDNAQDSRRDDDMKAFFKAVRDEKAGHVYKRFGNYQILKREVRSVLLAELDKRGLRPTDEETAIAEQTIAQASDFDSRLVDRADERDLDQDLTLAFTKAVTGRREEAILPTMKEDDPEKNEVLRALLNRGLIWWNNETGRFHPTAGGLLLLGRSPEAVFPQVRVACNAWGGKERGGDPLDRLDLKVALPHAVEQAFAFLKRNMRHTTRVEGFARVQIDEYPYEALREAVVNAVAHRDYDLQGSCIRIDKYEDRIEVLSPGLPPDPLTVEKLSRLDYVPCSRNPNLARGLGFFERIEEQGDGIRRIISTTTAMGLPRPTLSVRDGHFLIVFHGPGEGIQKLKPQGRPVFEVKEDLLSGLSQTQRKIVTYLLEHGEAKVTDLAREIGVSGAAIRKALKELRDGDQPLVVQDGPTKGAVYRLVGGEKP